MTVHVDHFKSFPCCLLAFSSCSAVDADIVPMYRSTVRQAGLILDLEELPNPEHHTVDIVKLLLILAMRTEVTELTTFADVIERLGTASSLEWKHLWPLLPVTSAPSPQPQIGKEAAADTARLRGMGSRAAAAAGLRHADVIAFLQKKLSACDVQSLKSSGTYTLMDQAQKPELHAQNAESFVNFLSKINVVRANMYQAKGMQMMGGSRAEPSLFLLRCCNTKFGCGARFMRTDNLSRHEAFCPSISLEHHRAHERTKAARVHRCPQCDIRYKHERNLKSHIILDHEMIEPRPCRFGCNSNRLYQSQARLEAHISKYHRHWAPSRCPVEHCASEAKFSTRSSLAHHIQYRHREISHEDRRELMIKHFGDARYLHSTLPGSLDGEHVLPFRVL